MGGPLMGFRGNAHGSSGGRSLAQCGEVGEQEGGTLGSWSKPRLGRCMCRPISLCWFWDIWPCWQRGED